MQEWDDWNSWIPDATATPPQEYNLPLESGITGNVRYAKSQTGFVLITVDISGSYTNATLIGTLPVGYRPAETVTALARVGGLFATIDVTSNGSVRVYNVNGTINNAAFSQIAYIAAD